MAFHLPLSKLFKLVYIDVRVNEICVKFRLRESGCEF